MAGKTLRLADETRTLMDDVIDLLYKRGLDKLPLSVREGAHDLGDGRVRFTQATVTHLGLLALQRHLTLGDEVPLPADPDTR